MASQRKAIVLCNSFVLGAKKYQRDTWGEMLDFLCFFLVARARQIFVKDLCRLDRAARVLTVISMRPAEAPPTVMSKKQTGLDIFVFERCVCVCRRECGAKDCVGAIRSSRGKGKKRPPTAAGLTHHLVRAVKKAAREIYEKVHQRKKRRAEKKGDGVPTFI